MSGNDGLTVTYSSKEIMDKISEVGIDVGHVLSAQETTNGRLDEIEEQQKKDIKQNMAHRLRTLERISIGMIIRAHPYRFGLIMLMFGLGTLGQPLVAKTWDWIF